MTVEITAYTAYFVDAEGVPNLKALNKEFTTPEEALLWAAAKCKTKFAKSVQHYVDVLEDDQVVALRYFYGMVVIPLHVRSKTIDVTQHAEEFEARCHELFMEKEEQ